MSGLVIVLDIRPEQGRLDYGSGLAVPEDSGGADDGSR